ncbi:MAG: 5'-methylthioadenosine/S-adenosylhomocysteine nucleosidase [Gammaproteobacteria bacterium]|nr:5'-methylthioadenosine/S-adenosylhomocysteine nucleosidase [Gammaproteobacteria bacterium]
MLVQSVWPNRLAARHGDVWRAAFLSPAARLAPLFDREASELIGIICAMPDEVSGFAPLGGGSQQAEFARVRLDGIDAVIALAGLGKVRAARAATVLVERWQCRALVSAGTAGGLDGAEPMQVVIGTELIQHDYGRSRGHGDLELFRPGDIPLPENSGKPFTIDLPAAQRRAYESAAGGIDYARFGRYASGDQFVNDAATRAKLVALGAIAVDMECAAVAQVAECYGLPWLVAKGISDDASASSHDAFMLGLAEAARRSAEVVGVLLPALLAR